MGAMEETEYLDARKRTERKWLTWSGRERLNQVVIMVVLAVIGLVFVFPYYYMFISSLRPAYYDFDKMPQTYWPRERSAAAYERIFSLSVEEGRTVAGGLANVGLVLNGVKNTLIQEAGIVLGGTLTSLFAAYAFAKGRFRGRAFFFYLLLSTMIIPAEITLVPKLVMFTRWGFVGTHWTLIVPAVLGAGGWFLMRMFLSTIPNAYIDAARIDGANEPRIVWSVIAPLAKPVVLVHALFTFLAVWNDLMGPLMYVNVRKNYTLAMVLYVIQQAYNLSYAPSHMDSSGLHMQTYFAGLVIGTLPTFLVFILFQRYITEGTIITGLKL